jgi:hypothetical protein
MSVSCEYCVFSGGGGLLHRADHSHRGVLPTVVCLSVIVQPRYEEAVAYSGRSSQEKKSCFISEDKVIYVINGKFVSPK